MTIKHIQFARLLYDKLISHSTHTVQAVARKTGMQVSELYKYCEGVRVVPAEFVSQVYNATGDVDFLNFIIDDTDKVLIDKHRGEGKKTVLEETLDVTASVGSLVKTVQKALNSNSESGAGISKRERADIFKNINMSIKELEDLRIRAVRS